MSVKIRIRGTKEGFHVLQELAGQQGSNYGINIESVNNSREIINFLDSPRVNIRVDWDGTTSSPGRFEVETGVPNTLIDADSSANQLEQANTLFLHLQRGPENSNVEFSAKAIPVVWISTPLPGNVIDPSFVAIRGIDYEYQGDGTDWVFSSMLQGVQGIVLELQTRTDYEVWLRLKSPTDQERWLLLDPIIHTDDGEPR